MTAEYFSSLCGVTTIEVHNISWAVGKAISLASSITSAVGGGSSSHSTTTSDSWTRTTGTSEAQRQLAYPDELMVMKENRQIIFVENLDPVPSRKITWYDDPMLKILGIDLYKSEVPKALAHPTFSVPPPQPIPSPASSPASATNSSEPFHEEFGLASLEPDFKDTIDDMDGLWNNEPPSNSSKPRVQDSPSPPRPKKATLLDSLLAASPHEKPKITIKP